MARPAVPVLDASVDAARLAGELDLAELMADHALLDLRKRPLVRQHLDVVAVARIGGHASGRSVGMRKQPQRFQVGQDVPHCGAAHAEAVVLHQRPGTHRGRRGDVFVDDGPQDRVGSHIQRADGAAWTSRHV